MVTDRVRRKEDEMTETDGQKQVVVRDLQDRLKDQQRQTREWGLRCNFQQDRADRLEGIASRLVAGIRSALEQETMNEVALKTLSDTAERQLDQDLVQSNPGLRYRT